MRCGALRGHLRFGHGRSLVEVALLPDGGWLCDTCRQVDTCSHVAWLAAHLRVICERPTANMEEK